MGPLRRLRAFDRTELLEAAARARARRRPQRAIALYRSVLAREPRSADLHARIAPILAETGQTFESWTSFRAAAKACQRAGQPERALAIYREAALYLPREYQVWQAIAHLQIQRGREAEAVETLLEGSRHLRARWARPQAIYLLRRAREIDAWRFEIVLELARLLAGSQQREEARLLLEGLSLRVEGERERRVRSTRLRVDPGPRALWSWLRALLRPPRSSPGPRPALVAAVVHSFDSLSRPGASRLPAAETDTSSESSDSRAESGPCGLQSLREATRTRPRLGPAGRAGVRRLA